MVISIVSNPRLGGRALCQQLSVVLYHHFIINHRQHPSWLGISSMIALGMLCTHFILEGKQSTKVNWPLTCGIFLSYPALSLMLGPFADSSFLAWYKVHNHSGGAEHPLCSGRKAVWSCLVWSGLVWSGQKKSFL